MLDRKLEETGKEIYSLVERLFPICRSITGGGVRKTLSIINDFILESGYHLKISEIPSGTQVFDWTIPKEWEIKDAFIEDEHGRHIIDFKDNNLYVMGYSAPVDKWVSLDELKNYVHTEMSQPNVIPYVTSYYKEEAGFCMSRNLLDSLKNGRYHIYINSRLFDGNLTYGGVVIPGRLKKEIFFSTYICHPSMANDNLSGPALVSMLIKYVSGIKDRRYTYRFIFIPETIGAVAYISRNLDYMKKHIYAGFNLSCVGDNNDYSIIHTISGETIADRILMNVIRTRGRFTEYPFLKRASDERQYNAPGVDLPVVGFCRSKYGEFPEYHTSADNLDYVSPEGFSGSYDVMTRCIDALECNDVYKVPFLCEPQLGKRGLYPTISQKETYGQARVLCDILAYADGKRDLVEISDQINVPMNEIICSVNKLVENELLIRLESEEK